jgi:hypothetical protein
MAGKIPPAITDRLKSFVCSPAHAEGVEQWRTACVASATTPYPTKQINTGQNNAPSAGRSEAK